MIYYKNSIGYNFTIKNALQMILLWKFIGYDFALKMYWI